MGRRTGARRFGGRRLVGCARHPSSRTGRAALPAIRNIPKAPLSINLVALVAVAMVTADSASRTVDAYHHGMTPIDTLWYHLPFAAQFAQATRSRHCISSIWRR